MGCARAQCARTGVPTAQLMTCIKRTGTGSLTTHLISEQCAKRFPRYENGCARAHVRIHPIHDLCKALQTHTPKLNTIGRAVPEIQKRGVHVRTCRDTPPVTTVKVVTNGSPSACQISTQSAQPLPRNSKRNIYGKGVRTCARADALMGGASLHKLVGQKSPADGKHG